MKGGGGINWLSCEEGNNDFRFFPSTEEGVAFMQLRHTHRLPIEVENEDGTKEIKERKPVFNSRTHGGTAKDIVDEYCEFLEKREVDRISQQKLSKKEFGAAIKQVMAPVNDWKKGIRPEFRWTGYAAKLEWNDDGSIKSKEKGVFDFSFSVGKKMDSLAQSQDRRGKVTTTNPFIDIDTGAILVINYDKKRDPAEMYQLSIDPSDPIAWEDSDLEWLDQQRSLAEQYIGSYRRLDFELAMEGLKRFDERNSFGVFDDPAFQAIVEEISGYYPEDVNEPMIIHPGSAAEGAKKEAEDPFEGAELKKKQAPAEEKEEAPKQTRRRQTAPPEDAEVGDNLDTMDRSQLLGYIQMNKLDVHATADHTDDQLRDFIRTEESLQEGSPEPEPAAEEAAPQRTSRRGRDRSSIGDSF